MEKLRSAFGEEPENNHMEEPRETYSVEKLRLKQLDGYDIIEAGMKGDDSDGQYIGEVQGSVVLLYLWIKGT